MKVQTINTGLNDEFILVKVSFVGPSNQMGSIEIRIDKPDGLLSEIKQEAIAKATAILKTLVTEPTPENPDRP